MIIMGYGHVSCLKMPMSIRDEEFPKTRDCTFVAYVTVTKRRTASERENVEKTAIEGVITNYFIHRKNLETGKYLLTLKVYDVTEENTEQVTDEHSHSTTLTSAQYQEFVSFRTIQVWLSAKGKKIKFNAVLDDASTVSYVSEEVAGALGLSVAYEKVTANVLRENVETFDSIPVSLTLESCDGNDKVSLKTLTCPRGVT